MAPLRKFNPGLFQSDDQVVEQFVVRHREFGILMDVLCSNIAPSPCQHTLVIAPRGRGKTMLLARVAAELRANEALQRFLPVRFMEESYEVFDLGDFWLDVLLHLAPEVARQDPETADQLRNAHAEFSRRPRGPELEEVARAVALGTAQQLGRKLVLMVENCQSLFNDVDERFGWGLRKTLQTEPNVVFLGTATAPMAALQDVEAPFYELFRTLLLEPLPLRECRTLWEAASGQARTEREVRPLQILTGGDPRLLVIAAGFAHHRSLRELLQELVALIDDHTEYFRSHLESLGKTERRVYLALVDLWRPSTTAEIATRARQEIRGTSSLLGRLVKRGAIAFEGAGQKRLYTATQPLYSIYYKLRRQRDEAAVVHGLIQWMIACFTADELGGMAENLAHEAAQSAAIREGFRSAFDAVPAVRTVFANAAKRIDVDEAQALVDAACESMHNDPSTAIGLCDTVLQRFGKDEHLSHYEAFALGMKGYVHGRMGNRPEALAAHRALRIRSSGEEPAQRLANCTALALKLAGLGRLGQYKAALGTFSDLHRRFGRDDSPAVQAQVAMALVARGAVCEQMGKAHQAIAAWKQVLKRFGNSGPRFDPAVAGALTAKARHLERAGDVESALATLNDLVQRFANSGEAALRSTAAMAMADRAELQLQLGRCADALTTLDRLASDFASTVDAKTLQWAEWTKARALLVQGDAGCALETLEAAYRHTTFDEETPARLLHHVPELIGCGLPEPELLRMLTSGLGKRPMTVPIVAALHQRNGETVRAPREVLRVAQDLAALLNASIERVRARRAAGRQASRSNARHR